MKIQFGRFITFEGGEGCGKSTQVALLQKYFNKIGISSIATREIGGCHNAEYIRDFIMNNKLAAKSELLMIMAARYEHIISTIIPALQKNIWVICDRFIDSTAAYQSALTHLSFDDIYDLHDKIMRNFSMNNVQYNINHSLMPDYTFLLDVDPQIAIERSLQSNEVNKFDRLALTFHQNINLNFNKIARLYSNRIQHIECSNMNVEILHRTIISSIQKLIHL